MSDVIKSRAKKMLNTRHFLENALPFFIKKVDLNCPFENQYVLRMIVKLPHEDFKIPSHVLWLDSFIKNIYKYHIENIGVIHPFVYVTIRHGFIESSTDDEWHVDGFSCFISHLPEANYIWVSNNPTEFVNQGFWIPDDFNPLMHNINTFLANQVDQNNIFTIKEKSLYLIDPYMLHRRPPMEKPHKIKRTFVRVSLTPIEIMDDSNTINPLISMREYFRNGVSIRNNLKHYEEQL